MATVLWTGNGQNIAQVATLQVTAAGAGGTLTATINGKIVRYTCIVGDTVATAALAWQALLSAQGTAPPEFSDITWTISSTATDTITATAAAPGTPFTLTSAGAGGATLTHTATQANVSQSDVGNTANWLRAGVAAIPVNGDDVVLADSAVPLLWNLTALVAVQFATFTRWQSFTGTVGLPEQNAGGYREYRPTYFQFVGPPAGILLMTLGLGSGGGPSRERYDVGAQRTALTILAAGGAQDAFSVRFLSTNANNTLKLSGTSLGVATTTGEVATFLTAVVDGGGSLALGDGVTMTTSLIVENASATLRCSTVPATLTLLAGAQVTVNTASGLTYAAVTAASGSRLTWTSAAAITALTLQTGSTLDKSTALFPSVIATITMDTDTCQILDPNSQITYTGNITARGPVQSGPFVLAAGRVFTIT